MNNFRFSLHVLIFFPIFRFSVAIFSGERIKKNILIRINLFPNGIAINLFFRFSNKKMKIEITFVLGDSLLNIKQDTQIYFSDENFCFIHEKLPFYF